ncbi:hypothetical protein D9M68_651060 [compost metagenome]
MGAVASGPRKHDPNRALAAFCRDRAEQHVDRMPLPARLCRPRHFQSTRFQFEISFGSDDVNVVGCERQSVLDLHHRHFSVAAQNAGDFAFAVRVEMHHHDECAFAAGRHGVEEAYQRLEPAGRRANADDGNVLRSDEIALARMVDRRPCVPRTVTPNN